MQEFSEVSQDLVGNETILLVDDDDAVRGIALEVLQIHGYQVIEAQSGAAALSIAKSHDGPIDLLLTDLLMPEMTGFDLADQLVKLRPGTKVLYMSGHSKTIVHQRLFKAETPLIQKPFDLDALLRKVREVLDSANRSKAV